MLNIKQLLEIERFQPHQFATKGADQKVIGTLPSQETFPLMRQFSGKSQRCWQQASILFDLQVPFLQSNEVLQRVQRTVLQNLPPTDWQLAPITVVSICLVYS